MINQRTAELTVGFMMFAGLISLVLLAFKVSGLTGFVGQEGMTLTAQFDNIGDLKPRAPVTISGVRVGQVVAVTLDPESYRAVVSFTVNHGTTKLATDTSAQILTEGLLGSNYISLTPGYSVEDQILKNGDRIETTYSALILEEMVGKLLFKLHSGEATGTVKNQVNLPVKSATEKPETVKAVTAKPEAAKPATAKSATRKSVTGKTETGKPATGKTESGKSVTAKLGTGKTETGKSNGNQ